MTIRIYDNKIEFQEGSNTYALIETDTGMLFTGNLYASKFESILQGTVSGYTSGGSTSTKNTDKIEKFSFASTTPATEVNNLSQPKNGSGGNSSGQFGYHAGGSDYLRSSSINMIEKFSFATSSDVRTVGNLAQSVYLNASQSSSDFGYVSAGNINSTESINTIQKFSFATDENAISVGNLTQSRTGIGNSSNEYGFSSGGCIGSINTTTTLTNTIDKFLFSSESNSFDVGDLSTLSFNGCGNSSETHGYISGSEKLSNYSKQIQKFSFSSNYNSVNTAELTSTRGGAGSSSRENGYVSGGMESITTSSNVIDKFSFITDSNSIDISNLSEQKGNVAGQQY